MKPLRMMSNGGFAQPPAPVSAPDEQAFQSLAASLRGQKGSDCDITAGTEEPASQAVPPPGEEHPTSHAVALARLEQRLDDWMFEITALIKGQTYASSGASAVSAPPRRAALNPHVKQLHRMITTDSGQSSSQAQLSMQVQESLRRHSVSAPGSGTQSGGLAQEQEKADVAEGIPVHEQAVLGTPRMPSSAGTGSSEHGDATRGNVSSASDCAADGSKRVANGRNETVRVALRQRWGAKMMARGANGHQSLERGASERWASSVASSKYFNNVIGASVVLNAILIAAQVQHEAVCEEPSDVFMQVEYGFIAIFTLEQIIRLLAFGWGAFKGKDKYWNTFDLSIVLASWVEVVIAISMGGGTSGPTSSNLAKLLKLPRVARVLRLCRTARFFIHLRIMVLMIVKSFLSLFWVIAVIFLILFLFALILTQNVTDYVRSSGLREASAQSDVIENFGSLFQTMYSLGQAMTGGRNWGEYARMLAPVGWDAIVTIVLFIFFTAFSVVNIVTGVFVDGAIEMAKTDRSTMVEKRGRQRVEIAGQLLELLIDMDSDQDGSITLKEFMVAVERPDVQDFLTALDINVGQAATLFQVLDVNGDGVVDIVEFVDGMSLLKGEAKSSDIQILLMQVRHLISIIGAQDSPPP